VAKHKKKKTGRAASSGGAGEEEESFTLPAAPNRISRPFAHALSGVKIEKQPERKERPAPKKRPAPPPPVETSAEVKKREYEERMALASAYSGVKRFDGKVEARPRRVVVAREPDPEEAVARSRFTELVARGIRFDIERDPDHVQGARSGASSAALDSLRGGRATAEAEIDLHGHTEARASEALQRFLRDARRARKRIVLVIHGIGRHSQGGAGILRDVVVDVITTTAAAHVLAFVTAEQRLGGAGALLVRLDA
jgi:DNA-nicking Smr family endonuclease